MSTPGPLKQRHPGSKSHRQQHPKDDQSPLFSTKSNGRGAPEKTSTSTSKRVLKEWAIYLGFVTTLILFVYSIHYRLPTPVNDLHDPKTGQAQFSEANARRVIHHLTETIGYRVSGTVQGQDTEDFVLKEVLEMKELASREVAKGVQGLPVFDTWVQTNDGSHRFDILGHAVMKMYTNMTNIIVRLSCGSECDENSILLNAHSDTTFGTPGAVDDGLGVGVLMELIRVLSVQPALKKNSVIFLFNNGEEVLQDASHSFITDHELKEKIKVVINIEAAGTGGPEILFQANSREMLDAYKMVPHPHGNVIANDLFKTGILLGDTDFRVFMAADDSLTGVDLAAYTQGFWYHTIHDTEPNMDIGLPQHTGENVLAMIRYLGDEVDMSRGFERTVSNIFFDFLGFFMVYSWATAIKSHIAIAALGVATIFFGASRPTLRSVTSATLSFVAALLAPNLVAEVFKSVDKLMLWYSHVLLPVLFFGPAALAGMLTVQRLFHDKKASTGANELSTLSGLQVFLNGAMGLLTVSGLCTSYLMAIFAAPLNLALIYNHRRVMGAKQTTDMTTYLVATALPTAYFCHLGISLLDTFIPLTGKIGWDAPNDNIVATIVGMLVFFSSPVIMAFSHRFGLQVLKRVVVGILILQLVVSMFFMTFWRHPYDVRHPKRIFAQHLRNLTSGESLLHVAHTDPGPFYDIYVKDLEGTYGTKAKGRFYTDHPDDWNAMYPLNSFTFSYVLDTEPFIRSRTQNATVAALASPLTDLIQDYPRLFAEDISFDPETGIRQLTILCTHPNYILTVLSFDAQLTGWSLNSALPSTERYHYTIRQAAGYRTDGWKIKLAYQAPGGAEDRLRFSLTSAETEGWGKDEERELPGAGNVQVMRTLVKTHPEFVSLTYFGAVVKMFDL